jgi:flagellar biosynthesis protein FlhB
MLKLDLQFFAGEKTEKATPKKRQEARQKGQVAKSTDVSVAISLLAMFFLFMFEAKSIGSGLSDIMTSIFRNGLTMSWSEGSLQSFFTGLVYQVGKMVAPVLVLGLVIGLFTNIIQVGFLFTAEALQFKPERLNPIEGFKKIYSWRAIVELMKSLLKIAVVGLATFSILWMNQGNLVGLVSLPLAESLGIIGRMVLQMGLTASILLIVISGLDYAYQRFDYEKNLRMSKQDIKDEYKKSEGDPLIKSKIRERQRQMAMRRMMQEVPKADVIITNPTHFAVALKYDETKMEAPTVVAKGADFVALKIREVATDNGVVIVEKRTLARALFYQLEIGEVVPETFFKAVAEILAFVYRLKGKVK